MEDFIHNFLKTVNNREHVLQLVGNVERLTLQLVVEEDVCRMVFHKGEVLLLEDQPEEKFTCQIIGNKFAIHDLVAGRESLRSLIRHDEIKVTGTFRDVLLLESLFYLTKPQQHTVLIS